MFDDQKTTCMECGMKIPLMGEICPYCHTRKEDWQIGCAGVYALGFILAILIGLFQLFFG